MSICEDDHIADLFSLLLEENWLLEPSYDNTCTNDKVFRKSGTDYDRICIRPGNNRTSSTTTTAAAAGESGFWVTIPLPTTSDAYLTHIVAPLDVYIYISNFIEYYTETTHRQRNLSMIQ